MSSARMEDEAAGGDCSGVEAAAEAEADDDGDEGTASDEVCCFIDWFCVWGFLFGDSGYDR